ncbi:uncharacterized protein LOC120670623 [Panicum virgatum]|uniref:Uncharacterized protein n=1 Tax=Panicum virgatum TaxID=38727 RepID=A0A8T0T382_PANVG|nr:uncharacterized protein LOC120670623 [Panicum virgatum]KAG2604787.1 hypothetical protein PVAP13_4NG067400 [Panicum virgatum]
MSISYKCTLFSIVEVPTPFFSAEPKPMAIRSSWYHHPSSTMAMISPRLGIRGSALRLSTSAHGSSSSSHLSFAAATDNNKAFEDQLRGIVCYRDEKGEMICEGYDEGPRLGMRLPEKACFPWPVGVQLTDFIQLATLPVFEDAEALQLKTDKKSQL